MRAPYPRWCRCWREIMYAVAALLSLWRTRWRSCVRYEAAAMVSLLSQAIRGRAAAVTTRATGQSRRVDYIVRYTVVERVGGVGPWVPSGR